MADAKKRFLIVPDEAWSNATLVSATSQAGLTVKQPETDTALGDMRVVVSGEPTEEFSTDLRIVRPGIVGDAEYSYPFAGTTKATVRQSPTVYGIRPDIIQRHSGPTTSANDLRYSGVPRAVPSLDGDSLILLYLNSTTKPMDLPLSEAGAIEVDGFAVGLGRSELRRVSLSSDTYRWGSVTTLTPTYTLTPANRDVFAHDVVAFPSWGKHLLVTANGSSGVIAVHTSDDDMLTLEQRSCVYLGDGIGKIRSLSLALLPSDRLVMLFGTDSKAFSAISDDRGLTWTVNVLLDYRVSSTSLLSPLSQVSVVLHSSGVLCATVRYVELSTSSAASPVGSGYVDRIAPGNGQCVALYTSTSGESWSGGTLTRREALGDVCTLITPEGHVATLGSLLATHYLSTGSEVKADPYLCFRLWEGFSGKQIGDPEDVIQPAPYIQGLLTWWPTHLFHTSPTGLVFNYNDIAAGTQDSGVFAYFGHTVGVFGLTWKGSLWVFSGVARELDSGVAGGGSPDADVTTQQSALLCLRAGYKQDLLEQLTFAYNIRQSINTNPLSPGPYADSMHLYTYGRSFNSVWDAWDDPSFHGFVKTQTGSALVLTTDVNGGDTEGGYLRSVAGPTETLYWTKIPASFPNADGVQSQFADGEALNGVVRVVFQAVAGGSITSEETAIKLVLADTDLDERIAVTVRLAVVGTATVVRVFDEIAAVSLGDLTIVGGRNKWVELLFSTSSTTLRTSTSRAVRFDLFARVLSDSDSEMITDFSYQLTDRALAIGAAAAETLAFGHFVVLSSLVDYRWKGLHLHRGNLSSRDARSAFFPLLQTQGVTSLNSSADTLGRNPAGFQPLSSRVANQQWSCRPLIATPQPTYLQQGVELSMAGRAIATDGAISAATTYEYAWNKTTATEPVFSEWRSVDSEENTVVVFSPQNDGKALAVFGRNTPAIRIDASSTNAWGALDRAFTVVVTDPVTGNPWGTGRTEYAHLWASDKDFVCLNNSAGIAVRWATSSAGTPGPWRSGQFRSQTSGQTFYAVVKFATIADVRVYQIRDNTDSQLLITDYLTPGGTIVTIPITNMAIISDRFAFDMTDLFMEGATPSNPNPHYAYTRISFAKCVHVPDSGSLNAHKLGALWFGHLHDLSEPDFNWQWQRTTESGNTLTETPAGPTYSKRNRQFRRRFLASKPIMKSALVSNGIDSPQQQIRGSWEETINLLERLEVDGTRCALIWQGERAEAGAQSSPTQRTADPLELIACRVESAGTLQNDAYTCQTMTLASTGSTDVPRPRASIAQIVFKEEF